MKYDGILILLLVVFGFIYSFYLTFFVGDFYIGFVFVLITIGLSSTIYVLGRSISYKIILYIWIAIIVLASTVLLFQWTSGFFESFRI